MAAKDVQKTNHQLPKLKRSERTLPAEEVVVNCDVAGASGSEEELSIKRMKVEPLSMYKTSQGSSEQSCSDQDEAEEKFFVTNSNDRPDYYWHGNTNFNVWQETSTSKSTDLLDQHGLTCTNEFPEMKTEPCTSASIDMDIENEENPNELIRKVYRSLKAEINTIHEEILNQRVEMHKIHDSINKLLLLSTKQVPIIDNDEDNIDTENIIPLPCSSEEQFDEFDKKLLTDKHYRTQIKTEIRRSTDKRRSMTRNIGDILRKFLTQDVARQFTPVKKVKGKRVFKDSELFKIIEDVISIAFQVDNTLPSREEIILSMMSVLHNVKDWSGCRAKRQRRKT